MGAQPPTEVGWQGRGDCGRGVWHLSARVPARGPQSPVRVGCGPGRVSVLSVFAHGTLE